MEGVHGGLSLYLRLLYAGGLSGWHDFHAGDHGMLDDSLTWLLQNGYFDVDVLDAGQ